MKKTHKLNIRFTATSPNDQMKGLMGQNKLKTNEGALFIFGEPKSGNFCIKLGTHYKDIIK